MTTINYRPEIDGLRAVAILPVLLFHAGFRGFSGGYVGVDVFFVISGYLITGIIAREIDENRFSIIAFYERRARRIMPALLVVILAVLGAAAWLYLPGDFESVPRSALAATLFLSNVSFFLETGYFQGGAETKPLLHTWSLAIEEQFYIGFPLLLVLLGRYASRWRTAMVAGIALGSFGLAVATQNNGDGFTFYLLPPRAWELFTGALLALGALPRITSRPLCEAIAAAGLAAIGFAVFTYDHDTTFPGMTALAPVLGAAALIHCAPGTQVGRLLALKPIVAIGLISYSLYLWHWPLIVFTEYAIDERLSGWTSVAVIAASFVIATVCWRTVEGPFRDRTRLPRAPLFGVIGGAMVAICAVSLAMVKAGPWPGRFDREVIRMAEAKNDFSPDRNRCHDNSAAGRAPCVLGANVPPTALLWGDSHGVEFAYILSRMAAGRGHSLVERTMSSCPPVLGYDPPEVPACDRVNRQVMDAIRADRRLRTIYLAGFWASSRYAAPAIAQGLDRTIAALVRDGRHVVLIGPVPFAPFDVPRRLAHLAQIGRLDQARGVARNETLAAADHIRAVADRWRASGLIYIDPAAAYCAAPRCAIVHDGAPLYFDSHHPSLAGARLVLAPLAKADVDAPPVVPPSRR